jgi:hypothetical protein
MLVGPVIFPLVAFPLVIFPPIVVLVIFVPPVILLSGVLMFCAFAEFNAATARIETIAANRRTIKANRVILVCSENLSNK